MRRAAAFLAAFMSVAGCRDISSDAYVELTGKIFVFNYRVATATYVITLGKLRPLPAGATFEARLENPRGGGPLTLVEKIWPDLDKIVIESPPVFCIVKGRPYKFSITIRNSTGNDLQKLEGSLTSSLDQTVLPDVPLVVGNGYEPNPALLHRQNGKISGGYPAKCEN